MKAIPPLTTSIGPPFISFHSTTVKKEKTNKRGSQLHKCKDLVNPHVVI